MTREMTISIDDYAELMMNMGKIESFDDFTRTADKMVDRDEVRRLLACEPIDSYTIPSKKQDYVSVPLKAYTELVRAVGRVQMLCEFIESGDISVPDEVLRILEIEREK